MPARRSGPGVVPLPPGIDVVLRGELGGVPGAVHRYLDRLDATVLRPRDAGERHRARRHLSAGFRHVDARLGLDRSLLRPATLHPVGVEGGERGDLHVDHPLARGHVAIQARHHHPDGETVLLRQRLPVHADREQRVPAIHHRVDGHADVHVVDVPHDDLLGAGLQACLAEHVGEQRALPSGVPDVAAADALRHAGERDVVVHHRPLHELVERDRHRFVHHAVDAQLPGRRLDRGSDDRGVDPVEVVVRRVERGQSRDVQLGVLRQRFGLDRGRAELDLRGVD